MSQLFVPPGHFYSPIGTADEAQAAINRARKNWKAPLSGISIDSEAMIAFWHKIAPHMAAMPFGDNSGDGGFRYHYINDMYSYGDASIFFGIVRHLQPKKIIEIGSGYSSALSLDIRDLFGGNTSLTFIEPYPDRLYSLLRPNDKDNSEIVAKKVQDVPMSLFEELGQDDILFIDSSHVAKTGSDVCHEIFEILPALRKGVVIHFHDCAWPFEYPHRWSVIENRSWNELYFLRAFLMYNRQFEIAFFNDFFAKMHANEVSKYPTKMPLNPGGGLWLRKL